MRAALGAARKQELTRTRGEQDNEHETGMSNTDGRSDVEEEAWDDE